MNGNLYTTLYTLSHIRYEGYHYCLNCVENTMLPTTPNWNDLRIFLEVYRTGSLSAASRQLKIDVSTASRHITSLERALSSPVFERHSNGLKITVRGREILEYVESMESQILAMMGAHLSEVNNMPSGKIRIGTMEGIASFYLAEKFAIFCKKYSEISVELLTSSHQVHVNRREADLFLSFYPYEVKGLDIMPIGKFSLYLYAAPSYLSRCGTPESRAELHQHSFISYIEDLVELDTVRWLYEVIERPDIAFSSSSMVTQMFAATGGIGMVLLPEFMQAEQFGLQKVLPETVSVSRVVWLSVHRDLRYLPKMKAVISFLIHQFSTDYPNQVGVKIE
ncbi:MULTISPECIES: LysR family transcriptional regulator [Klebsiella]|nr:MULTISPECIES: LysR family transcriptional regulator [Klebsiella]QQO29726.1 LysR family transcriptional regulator [Klebsiella michiganensis]MCW9585648.1 LysR family transcriptional regulator [Klebsiella pasteurii]MDR6616444.1 DNA-binding transcriptional LysR family regulator [Klebsiella sp. 1400]MDS7879370.1 LysR family transcriptional regulator [Klebsiella pasteurii]MDS7905478.1 LysR family transcriptional regulator [Klebsiella pasteurii]